MDRHGNAYSQDYLNQSDLSNRMASMGIGNGAPTSNLNQSNAPPSFHSHGLEVRGPGYAGNGGMPGNPLPVSAYEYMNEKSYPTPPQRFPQHQMNPMNPRGAPRSFVNGQSNIHQIRGNSGTSSPPQFVGSFDGGAGGSPGGAVGSGGGAPQVGAFNTYNSNSNGNAGGGGGKMMRDVDRLPSAYYAAPPQPPMGAQNFGAPLPLVMPPPHVAQYSQQQPYPATQYPNRGGGGSYSPPPNRNMQAHDFMRETQQLPQHAYYPSSSMSSMTNEGGVPSSFNQTSSPNSASTSTYSILNNNVPYTSSVLTTSSNSTYDMNNITVVEERRPVVDFDDIIESSFEKPTKMSSVTQKKLVLETEGLLSPNQDN
eukprot:gene6834-7369_t